MRCESAKAWCDRVRRLGQRLRRVAIQPGFVDGLDRRERSVDSALEILRVLRLWVRAWGESGHGWGVTELISRSRALNPA